MCPALSTDLKQEVLTDPYENFMRHHLQYYGYFRGLEPREEFKLSVQRRCRLQQEATDSDSDLPSSQEDQKKLIYSLLLDNPVFKSRQLVFEDQEGKVIPRLREPKDLFSSCSQDGCWQQPRWPSECEVIKEDISHIEWNPPDPEIFYKPTGSESKPPVVSEGTGTVVYEISPAHKGSYFKASRTGGRKFSNRTNRNAQSNNDLQFESRFESGNLQRAIKVGMHEYELTLRTDLYTSKHTQWFYFQVKNTRKGVPYRFTITNLMKSNSLYNAGMKPLLYSQQDAVHKGIGWRRDGKDIKYYKNTRSQDGCSLYCLTWTFEFPHDDDICYFAHCYPYTYSDLQRDLKSMIGDPALSHYCKLRTLCKSLAGNSVYLLTITSPSTNLTTSAKKKAVVVTARVHPGETNGSWMMKGFLDFILSDSPDAQVLRDTFIFKVVPMLNPDGVIVGNYRCSVSGRDLNRNYKSMLKDAFPCIWYTRSMVKRLLAEREIILYCDFHGHSRKNNVFMYGCNNKGHPDTKLHERIFPLMLSKNAPDKFLFKGCKFKVQKSKEGTGRIDMWKQGIQNSYTMESTFGGSTLGNRKDTHFTTQDLKSMGHHFCDTLLDYCDPDSSKFKMCLSELQRLVQEDIRKKMKQLGRDLDSDFTLSDISLSDLESSTSGSNSSESDGLPAHLVDIAEKFYQKKKRRLRSRKERNSSYQKRSARRKQKLHDGAEVSEPVAQIARNELTKTSGKSKKERKVAKMKFQEDLVSQAVPPEESPTTAAPTERPSMSYSRKPDSVSMKTQMINSLPTSYFGDFTDLDHVCHRQMTIRSRPSASGNRLPLIITVIQQSTLPPVTRGIASLKQHPLPFQNSDQQPVADHVLKREKSIVKRGLPSAGMKPYSFGLGGEKQKLFDGSVVPLDLHLSLSPEMHRRNKPRQEPLITLVSTEYFDGFLPKPKKDMSDSLRRFPGVSSSEPYFPTSSEDISGRYTIK
ncbi:cytosolic carboxypeptidase 2 [Xenopus laevis]|uniref:Cytosolic carboxypeptidase 2 n=2 Tax=Xenopus laevis TaxID=8355 RepID=A0A1L8GJ01_XENLA|nr:cytosolic carboxypeptidase 2 [Xenopus laevis]XP_018112913.1 cytosolic carboxypeptidase 2 [Xenopus laevis]OCT83803.1 hypothetical protein XELAEV_18021942mg [Xenopus laevis]